MNLLNQYLPRTEFSSYEDFIENYRINVPEYFNFGFDVVDAYAEKCPDQTALIWCDDHDHEKTFSFSDIAALSNRAANYFVSIGIQKGDTVLMILRRRWEYWICAVALHKIGAVLIPGSLLLTEKDIVYRANAADIKAMICIDDPFVIEQTEAAIPQINHPVTKILVDQRRDGWLNFEDAVSPMPDTFSVPDTARTKSSDPFMIFFTSGTTGLPKMVQHSCSYPLGHIVTAKYWQQVQENKLHLSVSDSGWGKFSWGKIYGQWLCGAVVFSYDMDKFIPSRLLQKMVDYQITTFCAPPTIFRFFLQEDLSKYDLSCIKHCCTAGEPLNPEVYYRWKERTGLRLYEGFGQTESTVLLANFPWFEPKIGSTGKPAPLYHLSLITQEEKKTESGEEGKIVVTDIQNVPPPGLFTGYNKNPELTKKALGGAYYNTGDVAWQDEDGYYWFVGRDDDVIKCSGYRIGPFEVESALIEHPSVVECAITGAPDPIRGQVVKATIVLAKGYHPSKELIVELQNHVKHATAPYKYPRVIEFVDELPKTLGGKIKRAQIRKKDADSYHQ